MRAIVPEGYEPRKSADEQSRARKARRIIALIGGQEQLQGRHILEIGCGSGVVTAALAEVTQPHGAVWGVDVVERLTTSDGFEFIQVDGTDVPFGSDSMDIVVSNHVIEHVGAAQDQLSHLEEIARVLRQDGFCYLATPNRWWIWEPHFALPFLSWLPVAAQHVYVRATKRAQRYDCRLVSRRELIEMVANARLTWEDVTAEAIRQSLPYSPLTSRLPDWLLRQVARISPTYVMTLRTL